MANTSALRKGAPQARSATKDVTKADPRPVEGKNKPLQVMVPPEVFDAFSTKAGEQFGFNKGSKSQLFMAMWANYMKS